MLIALSVATHIPLRELALCDDAEIATYIDVLTEAHEAAKG